MDQDSLAGIMLLSLVAGTLFGYWARSRLDRSYQDLGEQLQHTWRLWRKERGRRLKLEKKIEDEGENWKWN